MSWASLANNQIVSDTNLADACNTGVFVPKTSIPSTGRMLTATAASNYAFVNTTASSNQLVSKSSLSQYKACAYGPYNQYVYATDGDRVYKSTDGGFTFAYYTALPYSAGVYIYTALAASSTGQYVVVGGNTNNVVYVSNDFGASFTSVTITGPSPFTTFYIADIDMSESGQYIGIVGKNSAGSGSGQVTMAVSNNYGASFSVFTSSYSANTWTRASASVSGDGSRMSYVALSSVNNNSIRYYSNNYGVSWTSGGVSANTLFYDVCMNYSGQYQIVINYGTNPSAGGQINVSNNYGSGFSVRSSIGYGTNCGISSGGTVMYVFHNNGNNVFSQISVNSGGSFSQTTETNPFNISCPGIAVGNTLMLTSAKPYYCRFNYPYFGGSGPFLNYYMPESNTYCCDAQPLSQTYTFTKIFRKSYSY